MNLIFEFRKHAVTLLVYNYAIVLLIVNKEFGWDYPFKDSETANRYGSELIQPTIQSKFGFLFSILTIVVNTFSVMAIISPKRKFRKFLFPPILWNVYTIAAVAENILEILWTMCILEVPVRVFTTTFLVGIFMVCLQSTLTMQVLRFYEYLNYVA